MEARADAADEIDRGVTSLRPGGYACATTPSVGYSSVFLSGRRLQQFIVLPFRSRERRTPAKALLPFAGVLLRWRSSVLPVSASCVRSYLKTPVR